MRLFRFPDGTWITPRNMVAQGAAMRADGYRGPWFPTIPADIPAFMRGDGYIKVFRAITAYLAGHGEPGPSRGQAPPIGLPGAGPGPGGFGSAFSGPVYVVPDEAVVKEALQGFQVAVTGQLENELLDEAVATYLTTHKKDFDSKGQQFDPFQAAKKIIRGSASYKDIHELRPESEDELAWVTTQQGRLRTLGLTSSQSEQLGIKLARVGASQEAANEAGSAAFFRATGRVASDQRDSLKRTARSALSLL